MSAPTRVLPAASDDAGWTPEAVAAIAGVTIEVRDCCSTFVGSEPCYCWTDGWIDGGHKLPADFFGRGN